MTELPTAPRAPGRLFALTLGLTALITPLAVHLFFPVIPAVKAAMGLSSAYAQLTFSIALFGMAFATLFYGSLSDRYGRRPVLLSGLGLFLAGSVLSAIAPTPETLVLGRLIQAFGAGCALTLTRAIARDAYRADQLVKAIAYLTMFGTLGPMISPIIGGVLTDTLGWRSVFGFALLAGGAISLTAYFVMYETNPAANRKVAGVSVTQSYLALFRRLRFNACVFQSGFNTSMFMVMASAPASSWSDLPRRRNGAESPLEIRNRAADRRQHAAQHRYHDHRLGRAVGKDAVELREHRRAEVLHEHADTGGGAGKARHLRHGAGLGVRHGDALCHGDERAGKEKRQWRDPAG